ncbi:putative non-specific serine/threonine protein kinase [Helianthus anomalus]
MTGHLPNGQVISIKRAQEGSSQGGLEFKNDIELLSRVHDKNVVGLIGFCFDKGEQMFYLSLGIFFIQRV